MTKRECKKVGCVMVYTRNERSYCGLMKKELRVIEKCSNANKRK